MSNTADKTGQTNTSPKQNDIVWYNQKNPPLYYQSQITPKRLYFLYGFLGDGYQITRQEYKDNLDRWKQEHPDWTISILRRNYDSLDDFVKDTFAWFWLTYQNYPKNIQRCDVIRYMLMYQYGGVYSDLDVTPKRSVNWLLDEYPWANVIFGVARIKPKDKCRATTKHETIRRGEPEIPHRLSNYFMVSRIPYHPIWIDILKLAKNRSRAKITSQYGIIYTTGPDIVTTALSKRRHMYQDIAIVPIEKFTQWFPHGCSSFSNDNSWRKRCGLPASEKKGVNVT